MAGTWLTRRIGAAVVAGVVAVAGLGAGHVPSLVVPAVAGLVGTASTVEAGPQDFTLTNGLPQPIRRAYVSESSNPKWEEDVLGRDILSPGESTPITFSGYADSVCMFDVRVVLDDGSTWDVLGINLCDAHAITFVLNEAGGVAYVVTPA